MLPAPLQCKIECGAELLQIWAENFGGKVDLWCHFSVCTALQMQN